MTEEQRICLLESKVERLKDMIEEQTKINNRIISILGKLNGRL